MVHEAVNPGQKARFMQTMNLTRTQSQDLWRKNAVALKGPGRDYTSTKAYRSGAGISQPPVLTVPLPRYTLHPTPYTLHAEPFTLHSTPFTLHPTTYTLHPSPYILHPTHFTLHPTPQPLRPQSHTASNYAAHCTPGAIPSRDHLGVRVQG